MWTTVDVFIDPIFRLGALDENVDDIVASVIQSANQVFEGAGKVMVALPLWKISPRLSKEYMQMANALEVFAKFTSVSMIFRFY